MAPDVPWTNADMINLAIAIGTCIAALAGLTAAIIAVWTARKTERFAQKAALEEKNRWLTDILFSLANQCNECVSALGRVLPTEPNLSRMITILCNAIELIEKEKHIGNRDGHLKSLWIFLHSSIWVELKTKDVLNSLDDLSPSARGELSSQYEKVRDKLMSKVS